MSQEKKAGDLVDELLAIYSSALATMRETGELSVPLLKEIREFTKQHGIELDAQAAPMQDLSENLNELEAWRRRRAEQ